METWSGLGAYKWAPKQACIRGYEQEQVQSVPTNTSLTTPQERMGTSMGWDK